MKIAIIGANGQLGNDICNEFINNSDEIIALNHTDFEIKNELEVFEILNKTGPDIVINTAAYHNVEKCEENPIRSYEVNAIGAWNLAKACKKLDTYFIQISTDYVFDGNKKAPYIETDRPVPLNVYGNTKLAGEHYIEGLHKKSLIMRVSGIYGKSPCRAKGGLNFVELMLKLSKEKDQLRVVDNEYLTPTSTREIARQLVKISQNPIYGLCHATAEGYCSWYEFANEILRIKNISTPVNIASPGEFPIKVPRPEYSVLENKTLKDNNINIFKSWKDGLLEYLEEERPSC